MTPLPDARDAIGVRALLTKQTLLTTLLVLLYVAARLWKLSATCLWFDEIFGVTAARHTWVELWRFVAADLIHPPLFYALLKIWMTAGGDSLLWLRLLPALTSVLALVPFFLLARELRLNSSTTNLALLLLAANGYLIKYAQEVRMYSLLLMLALVSLWLLARLMHSERASRAILFALFFVNLLLAYAHYYGLAVIACEASLLALKDRRKLAPFLLSCAAALMLLAPWIAACVFASNEGAGLAQNIGWIERPGVAGAAQMLALLNEPFHFRQSSDQPLYARVGLLLGFILVGLPLVILLLRHTKSANKDSESKVAALDGSGREDGSEREDGSGREGVAFFLAFFALAPFAIAFVASYAMPFSVWGTRHLIFIAAPYALLAGIALDALRPQWLKAATLVILGCWFLTAGALRLVSSDGEYIWCAWDGLVASAVRDEAASVVGIDVKNDVPTRVYAFEDLVAYHLWFALEREGSARRFKVVTVKDVPGVTEDAAYFLPRRFDGVTKASGADSIGGERFWAAMRAEGWDESRPPLKLLLERGYRTQKIYETGAQGQRAFLVLFVRDDAARALPTH